MKQVVFTVGSRSQGGHMVYILILALLFVVLIGYLAIGKIAEKKLETVQRCEDAELIIEERVNRRITLCVIGFLILLCMVKAIIKG